MNSWKTSIGMFALIIALPVRADAQRLQYDVTFVAMDEDSGIRLRHAKTLLENALEARGAQRNENAGWLFLIGVSEPNEADEVALSITPMQKLPEEIVQIGRREQAVYKRISEQDEKTYPDEGRWVREYMSEEFMRDFVSVQAHYLVIAAQSDLEGEIERVVAQFYRTRVR